MFEINPSNYHLFAYTNNAEVSEKFDGIVLNFHGLNRGLHMRTEQDVLSEICAKNHLLYVFPYINPWSWMNAASVIMIDQLLDAIFSAYGLPEDFPIGVAGRSMGGQCALIYAVHGKYKPISCALNCPVCDMLYHYSERDDVPRTMYSAFSVANLSLEESIATADPMSCLEQLPEIPYFFAHCEEDSKVNKGKHSDRLVPAMRERGLEVTYLKVPLRDHIDLTPEAYEQIFDFIVQSFHKETRPEGEIRLS